MVTTNSKPRTQTQNHHQEPPPPNTPLTCKICIEPIDTGHKFRNITPCCTHSFCTDCVVKYITFKVTDDVAAHVACPGPTCHVNLDPLTCQTLLTLETFTKWSDNLAQHAVLGLDHCYCPNRECSAMIVNECGDRIRKAKCPDCKSFFCFKCGVKWHAGYRCEESGETRDQNDVVFGVLAERRKWMRCPACYHCIELIQGCNIVKCRCGTEFCYKCGKNLGGGHWCECKTTRGLLCMRFCYCIYILLSLIGVAIILIKYIH